MIQLNYIINKSKFLHHRVCLQILEYIIGVIFPYTEYVRVCLLFYLIIASVARDLSEKDGKHAVILGPYPTRIAKRSQ